MICTSIRRYSHKLIHSKWNVKQLAGMSRLIVICLQFIFNILIPDHVHDAGVFIAPKDHLASKSYDWIVELLFGGFRRWDAAHYLFIAEHGYVYEGTLAFQILYPFSIRFLTDICSVFLPSDFVSIRELSLVVAVIMNIIFFVMAAQTLHHLTDIVFGDRRKANVAVFLFCISPASIFFSAPYTESLFAWLSFSVMKMSTSDKHSLNIFVPLGLSLICRSNGFVNFGFLFYFAMKQVFQEFSIEKGVHILVKIIKITVLALIPYIILQIYNYNLFCREFDFAHVNHVVVFARENNLILSGTYSGNNDKSPWCGENIPISYTYVQNTYWNVGFFKYYKIKQIPNFLWASPILFIFLFHCFKYLKANKNITRNLGIYGKCKEVNNSDKLMFPFIIHGLFLTIFCICIVHIQVTTRLLASSSPALYWFCADYFIPEHDIVLKKRNTRPGASNVMQQFLEPKKVILLYFYGYTVMGAIMFCNFFHWT